MSVEVTKIQIFPKKAKKSQKPEDLVDEHPTSDLYMTALGHIFVDLSGYK
jgi:hypothetical protein